MTEHKPTPRKVLHNGARWIVQKHERTYSAQEVALFLIGEEKSVRDLYVDIDGDNLTIEYETRKSV